MKSKQISLPRFLDSTVDTVIPRQDILLNFLERGCFGSWVVRISIVGGCVGISLVLRFDSCP